MRRIHRSAAAVDPVTVPPSTVRQLVTPTAGPASSTRSSMASAASRSIESSDRRSSPRPSTNSTIGTSVEASPAILELRSISSERRRSSRSIRSLSPPGSPHRSGRPMPARPALDHRTRRSRTRGTDSAAGCGTAPRPARRSSTSGRTPATRPAAGCRPNGPSAGGPDAGSPGRRRSRPHRALREGRARPDSSTIAWSTTAGSGSSHGRRGGGSDSSSAARTMASTADASSVARRRSHSSTGDGAAGRSGESGSLTRSRPTRRDVGPVQRAAWNVTRSSGREAHHRPTRQGLRERRRPIVPHHVARLGGVVDPQRDAQVGVGADVVGDHAGRSLGRQHDVHAEAASALGDGHERGQEVGEFVGQRGELVDDHDQPGNRFGVADACGTR